MAGNDDSDDRRVKDLLDPALRADLERWFTLPSFDQLADRKTKPEPPAERPEVEALLKARANAIAAVDPALLADHVQRMDAAAAMIVPLPPLELRVDPSIARMDLGMIDRHHTIAEPREYERSPDVEDDLADRTPQALLRDLHRPELMFDKVFEMIDPGADQRLDGVALVREMMSTDWRMTVVPASATALGTAALDELRAVRRLPWTEIKIPSRAVPE
jgi:hypothetical protein